MREGRTEGRKKCVGRRILLKSLTTNVDLRTSVLALPLNREDFRTHHRSDNEFIIPRNNYVSDTQRTEVRTI